MKLAFARIMDPDIRVLSDLYKKPASPSKLAYIMAAVSALGAWCKPSLPICSTALAANAYLACKLIKEYWYPPVRLTHTATDFLYEFYRYLNAESEVTVNYNQFSAAPLALLRIGSIYDFLDPSKKAA
jgi:hypothetical protein